MSQHDGIIANDTGANVRSDINNALAAILSNSSGSTEPSTTYAFQWWYDTTNNLLKLRNSANSAWITLPFDPTTSGEVNITANSTATADLAFSGGDVTFGDNDKAIFGAGSDLQIYHDSSDSIINDNGTGSLKLQTGASTKLEVVSSGIDVTGTVTADGLTVEKSAAAVSTLNRTTSDGDIVEFRKDGTTVGSIGTESGNVYLQGSSADCGIDFVGDQWVPFKNSARVDNTVKIGTPTYRFTDLYLSGGVYLGGTGSANYLDDYEEGTWTPIIAGATGEKTATAINMRYTKIGNLVTVSGTVAWNSTDSLTGAIRIKGLPFNVASPYTGTQQYRAAGSLNGTSGVTQPSGYQTGLAIGSDANTTFIYLIARSTTSYTHTPSIANSGAIYGITMTYETTS